MSLILEALKRSEAERRLGEAPDLLAPSPAFVGAAPARTSSVALIAGVATVLAVAIAFAWWWFAVRDSGDATPRVAASPAIAAPDTASDPASRAAPAVDGAPALLGVPANPAPAPPPAPALPAQAAAPNVPPDPMAPLLPPDTVVGNSPVPVEPQPAPAGEPPKADAPVAASNDPVLATTAGQPAVDPAATSAPATNPPPMPESAAPPPPEAVATTPPVVEPPPEVVQESPASDLPDLSALPLAVRQSLPPLVLNMHLYRATPSDRVVILDGKRLHEGESLGDIQVAEIRSDGVVLVAQGQRFLLSRLPR